MCTNSVNLSHQVIGEDIMFLPEALKTQKYMSVIYLTAANFIYRKCVFYLQKSTLVAVYNRRGLHWTRLTLDAAYTGRIFHWTRFTLDAAYRKRKTLV